MYATLIKTLMLEIVILGVATFFYFQRSQENRESCFTSFSTYLE
jgi:hypothetical protein